jgi:hypothetical protein
LGQPLGQELLDAEHLHRAAQQVLVAEGVGAQVRHQLIGRLGERGQQEGVPARARGGEGHLGGERGLAAARRTHHQG